MLSSALVATPPTSNPTMKHDLIYPLASLTSPTNATKFQPISSSIITAKQPPSSVLPPIDNEITTISSIYSYGDSPKNNPLRRNLTPLQHYSNVPSTIHKVGLKRLPVGVKNPRDVALGDEKGMTSSQNFALYINTLRGGKLAGLVQPFGEPSGAYGLFMPFYKEVDDCNTATTANTPITNTTTVDDDTDNENDDYYGVVYYADSWEGLAGKVVLAGALEAKRVKLLLVKQREEQQLKVVEEKEKVKVEVLSEEKAKRALTTGVDDGSSSSSSMQEEKSKSHSQPSVLSERQWSQVANNKNSLNKLLKGWQIENNDRLGDALVNTAKSGVDQHLNDSLIYGNLFRVLHAKAIALEKEGGIKPETGDNKHMDYSSSANRAGKRVSGLTSILPSFFIPKSLLDIGCAEGSITGSLAQKYKIGPDKAQGVDIAGIGDDGYSAGRESDKRMTFQVYDGINLPFDDNSFDLIVAVMSFHHVEHIDELLTEVFRVLAPGGYLVIREHDCEDNERAVVIDIVHGLYSLVWRNPPEWPGHIKEVSMYRCSTTTAIEESGEKKGTSLIDPVLCFCIF